MQLLGTPADPDQPEEATACGRDLLARVLVLALLEGHLVDPEEPGLLQRQRHLDGTPCRRRPPGAEDPQPVAAGGPGGGRERTDPRVGCEADPGKLPAPPFGPVPRYRLELGGIEGQQGFAVILAVPAGPHQLLAAHVNGEACE